jgi:hypothetical protein
VNLCSVDHNSGKEISAGPSEAGDSWYRCLGDDDEHTGASPQNSVNPVNSLQIISSRITAGQGFRQVSGATPPWGSVVEHARRRAQDACSLVAVQCRRLKLPEPEGSRLAVRVWADVQMLMIALRQLRRSVELAALAPALQDGLVRALAEFDGPLPDLWRMRSVEEHFETHHVPEIEAWDGRVFTWADGSLNVDEALKAAERLLATMVGVGMANPEAAPA